MGIEDFDGDEGVESVERQMRIHKLKQDVTELGGAIHQTDDVDALPPQIEEQFLRHVLGYETAPDTTNAEQLEQDGVKMPAPATLDDDQLSLKLWQVIDALARRHVFLSCTDHLSDRELYCYLWEEGLQEQVKDIAFHPDGAWHLDTIGSGSAEDTFLYMKYYADEETRVLWKKDWPEEEMPPHEDPPYDRDRHLPRWNPRGNGGER